MACLMYRMGYVAPFLAMAATVGLAACGGSSSTPSTTPTPVTNAGGGGGGGGGNPFCTQGKADLTQLQHIGTGVTNTTTPTLSDFKNLLNQVDMVLDALDSSAPSAIKADFDTAKAAYDTANAQAQQATTFAQVSAAFQSIATPTVRTAASNINTWVTANCKA